MNYGTRYRYDSPNCIAGNQSKRACPSDKNRFLTKSSSVRRNFNIRPYIKCDYGFLNLDLINSLPLLLARNVAMSALKNETVYTGVARYSSANAYKEEEHTALHSTLKNSNISYPHSFIGHPIHTIPGDYNSEIVALIGGGVAWDFALRNLLPEGVDGIIVETENNCNQSFTYQITGPDAFFIGNGGLHETKYENMKVVRSLSVHTHPNFTTTSGHCYYSMVGETLFL
jgi:hypothetical protein